MTNCIILRPIPQKRLKEYKSNSENRIRYSQYNKGLVSRIQIRTPTNNNKKTYNSAEK